MASGTISATEARAKLYDLLEEVDKLSKRIIITRHGRAKAILVNPDELEGLEETHNVLRDKRAMQSLEKSRKDIKAKRVYSFKEVTGQDL